MTRGTPWNLVGNFTDPGVNDAPWTYTINWGDGTPTATGTGTPGIPINASHTFATVAAARSVRMTVHDKDGRIGTSNTIVVTVQ